MKIVDHRLYQDDGSPYPFVQSPNGGNPLQPRYLIIHYTAGLNPEAAVRTLTDPNAQASAHLVIGQDGSVTQLMAFNRIAWHAGVSTWEGLQGLNSYSIGIELDNLGQLTQQGVHPDGMAQWVDWLNQPYNGPMIEAVHKNGGPLSGWPTFSPEQIEVTMTISQLLIQTYGLINVLGHDDISPGRKIDPGPAFPMESFRARVMGRAVDAPPTETPFPPLYETTDKLNIRSGPSTDSTALPGSPLPEGTKVDIKQYQGSWRFVDVQGTVDGVMDMEGWVHGAYLRQAADVAAAVQDAYPTPTVSGVVRNLYATTDKLNIRATPSTDGEKLPGSPLPFGTKVEVLDAQDVWRKVDVLDTVEGITDLQGWVDGQYLERVPTVG